MEKSKERNSAETGNSLTYQKLDKIFMRCLRETPLRIPHNGPEPASKIQVSHKLLCMSLFQKKIKEEGRNSWFWFGKEGIFSFKIENLWYATSVCCCLEKKKPTQTAGIFSINTFITSPELKELLQAFFKAQPLCTEGTVTHMYPQKAALPCYGICMTALATYLH